MVRLGEKKTLTATIGVRDEADKVAQPKNLWPGVAVVDLTSQVRQEASIPAGVRGGVVVGSANQDTPAAIAGLQAGDVITSVDGHPVRNVKDFYRALGDNEHTATFQISRDGTDITIGV